MKLGAVILVAGVGIPDEEMEKFLEMKRPTIFEQMIVSYQRAGVADIALVTRDGMADKIEQTLHRRGVTFLDIESDSFELAVLKGLSYLSDTCERIFVGDIRFPFFQPDILLMMQKRQAELLGAVYGGMFGDLICTSQACARNICKKLEQQIEESAEMAEGTVRSTGVAAFWKQFGYRIAHIEVENEGILVKVTSAREYEERRQIFAEKQIRGHVKVSLAVNRSFFGPGAVTLLTQIDRLGSVREACTKTGMSYSKGWKLIHTAEEETGWKIVERMSGRRVCEKCGASYHIINKKSKVEGVCDLCGGKTVIRKDDQPATVLDRLKAYHEQTEPLVDFYRTRGKLAEIKFCPSIEETTAEVMKALEA